MSLAKGRGGGGAGRGGVGGGAGGVDFVPFHRHHLPLPNEGQNRKWLNLHKGTKGDRMILRLPSRCPNPTLSRCSDRGTSRNRRFRDSTRVGPDLHSAGKLPRRHRRLRCRLRFPVCGRSSSSPSRSRGPALTPRVQDVHAQSRKLAGLPSFLLLAIATFLQFSPRESRVCDS